ncbi:hypothetical protein EVAR_34189_1 [Eumeta japonica]|uniref:Uncharacterized protein n=1 Tax=Eumeta variegata TaxID=151549 RepID=A0A4C1WHM9_EUMVA|nr:hypothetical protein EVAR_34189_1 [Eumeta japonica]
MTLKPSHETRWPATRLAAAQYVRVSCPKVVGTTFLRSCSKWGSHAVKLIIARKWASSAHEIPLTENRRKVKILAVVYRPVSGDSDGLLPPPSPVSPLIYPPSFSYPIPVQEAGNALVSPLQLRLSMGGDPIFHKLVCPLGNAITNKCNCDIYDFQCTLIDSRQDF